MKKTKDESAPAEYWGKKMLLQAMRHALDENWKMADKAARKASWLFHAATGRLGDSVKRKGHQ
jgi:hypothetical protein